jgi:mannose-6-phosphate isomerase-like protein (cupin superfamily)
MADYTKVNLRADVEDMAPGFGVEGLEARFARKALEMTKGGLAYFHIEPGVRTPWGHIHSEQEEIYLVVSGSARFAVGDEILDVAQWDAVRIPAGEWRAMEAGPEGAEVIAYGAPFTENKDAELKPGWWPEEG